MSQPELKPCPFCGDQPEVTKHFKRDEYCLVHRCQYIPAHIDFTTMAGILKRWNTRADPASPIHPCHASLAMPERKKWDAFAGAAENMKSDAFNNALDEVSLLNASLAAPIGWKLVPPEPTAGMCEAGASVPLKNGQSEADWVGDIYRAMISKAASEELPIPMHPCIMQLDKLGDV